MAHKITLFLALVLCASVLECKIVLPNKLRYLENMLNADLIAKAVRMRQRADGNPNMLESEKTWPTGLVDQYQDDKTNSVQSLPPSLLNSIYQHRISNAQQQGT